MRSEPHSSNAMPHEHAKVPSNLPAEMTMADEHPNPRPSEPLEEPATMDAPCLCGCDQSVSPMVEVLFPPQLVLGGNNRADCAAAIGSPLLPIFYLLRDDDRAARRTDRAGAYTCNCMTNSRRSSFSGCGKSVPVDVDYSFISPHTPTECSTSFRLRAVDKSAVRRAANPGFSCLSIN